MEQRWKSVRREGAQDRGCDGQKTYMPPRNGIPRQELSMAGLRCAVSERAWILRSSLPRQRSACRRSRAWERLGQGFRWAVPLGEGHRIDWTPERDGHPGSSQYAQSGWNRRCRGLSCVGYPVVCVACPRSWGISEVLRSLFGEALTLGPLGQPQTDGACTTPSSGRIPR